jgi:hypothetical protein
MDASQGTRAWGGRPRCSVGLPYPGHASTAFLLVLGWPLSACMAHMRVEQFTILEGLAQYAQLAAAGFAALINLPHVCLGRLMGRGPLLCCSTGVHRGPL